MAAEKHGDVASVRLRDAVATERTRLSLQVPPAPYSGEHVAQIHPTGRALVEFDTDTRPTLLFGAWSTVVFDTRAEHPRSCRWLVEVVVTNAVVQLGVATDWGAVNTWSDTTGTGDDATSLAVDGVRQTLWCGGAHRGSEGYNVDWAAVAASGAPVVVGLSVDLDARRAQHYWAGTWHDLALPADFFASEPEFVFPAFAAAGGVIRVIEMGP